MNAIAQWPLGHDPTLSEAALRASLEAWEPTDCYLTANEDGVWLLWEPEYGCAEEPCPCYCGGTVRDCWERK